MRWIVLKDLQILRRSPLLLALLVIYPVLIAVLIGAALSGGPERPRVAFVNLVPQDEQEFTVGGEQLDVTDYAPELFESIDPIRVDTREEAVELVRSGEALGALVIPEDATERLQSTINLSGGEPPEVEVLYNAEDPVKRRYVESTIEARLAAANRALSERLTEVAAEYLDIVVSGGQFSLFGNTINVLGLERSATILRATIASLPEDAPERTALEQVAGFAELASENLDISEPVLASIGEPVEVRQTIVEGRRTPLDSFAVAVAVTISLMFVTLLLAAGLLALEREEHAFNRLVRGLVGKLALLAAKIGLAALCAFAVTLVMLAGLAVFIGLDWSRAYLWIPALALGALAFGALGVAIGALAREVRAASLLAFLLSLPVAFLALVPSGSVSASLFEAIEVVNAAFPFKPALQALNAGLHDADPGVVRPMLHLLVLTLVFGALGRVALRRFG